MSIPCLIIAAVVDSRVEEGGGMEDRVQLTMALTMAIGVVRPNSPPRRLEIQVGSKLIEGVVGAQVCFLAGLFRLGGFIDFISNNVLTGFIHASALLVGVSMAPKLLGVSIEKSPVIYESLPRTLDALPEAKTGSVVSPNAHERLAAAESGRKPSACWGRRCCRCAA